MRTKLLLALTSTLFLSASPALAQSYADEKPSSFGAEAPALAAPKENPVSCEDMLHNCDLTVRQARAELKAAETDAIGVPFLGLAYLALWLVLMAFFFSIRLRQKHLMDEIATLRERLSALSDERP